MKPAMSLCNSAGLLMPRIPAAGRRERNTAPRACTRTVAAAHEVSHFQCHSRGAEGRRIYARRSIYFLRHFVSSGALAPAWIPGGANKPQQKYPYIMAKKSPKSAPKKTVAKKAAPKSKKPAKKAAKKK